MKDIDMNRKDKSSRVITMCLKDLNLRLEFAEKKGHVDKRRVTVFHGLEMSFCVALSLLSLLFVLSVAFSHVSSVTGFSS